MTNRVSWDRLIHYEERRFVVLFNFRLVGWKPLSQTHRHGLDRCVTNAAMLWNDHKLARFGKTVQRKPLLSAVLSFC